MKYMRYSHFSKTERLEISVLLKKGYSAREIAFALGKHHSSVSREIANNSVNGIYDPPKAHHKAYVKRKYSKYQGMKVRGNQEIASYVEEKMKLDWSPEAIAGRLSLDTGGRLLIHHASIYKYLYSAYGQHLCQYLQYKRYRSKRRKETKPANEIIKNRVFIDQRPEVINQRLRCGDFEGDTLGVPKTSRETLAGTVDRKSRYFLGKKIPRLREAMSAFDELLRHLNPFSITLDNGVENARYTILGIPTFFCHPYSAWEKPSIENTFKRLRRYIPKKSSLSNYSDEEISAIIDKMNNTPRKCLDWRTPKEVFFEQQLKQPNQLPIFNLECRTSG